jgi:tripartite motif-containing protein 71
VAALAATITVCWLALAPGAAHASLLYQFAGKWGQPANGSLNAPGSAALDGAGNLYVADGGTNRIQEFGSTGNFIREWGGAGSREGEFDGPSSIVVDGSGHVYVSEFGNNRVQEFDSSGNFIRMWGWGVDDGSNAFQICTSGCQAGIAGSGDGQLASPRAGSLAMRGTDILVPDSGNNRVNEYSSTGSFVSTWGWGVDDGSAALQTCTSGCQAGIAGSGDGQLSTPRGVGVDGSGNVYVSNGGTHRIQKFDNALAFVTKWGSIGPAENQLNAPRALAVDSSANVYVVESTNNRVQEFNSSGGFVRMWGWGVDDGSTAFQVCTSTCQAGISGSGDGEFAQPNGVAVKPDGTSVYVADSTNGRVQKFDGSANFVGKWGGDLADGQLKSPFGIAVEGSGTNYVTDSRNQRIQKFGASGTFITKWGSRGSSEGQFKAPDDVAVDNSGHVYVTDEQNNRIQKFDSSGGFLRTWGWGVDDGSSAFQTCTSGCEAGIFGDGDGQFGFTARVAVDPAGSHVFVTDFTNNRVEEFDSSGTFIRMWGAGVQDGTPVPQICTSGCQAGSPGTGAGMFNTPMGMAVDGSGNVYVADQANNRIQEFDSSGNFIRMWGWGVQDGAAALQVCTSGCQAGISGSGDGEFNAPDGIDLDGSNNLFVADSFNHRIQVFSSTGAFLTKFSGYGSQDGKVGRAPDVELDGSGRAFVVDDGNSRIQKFVISPPHNTVPPSISGTPAPGHTLTCRKGTWSGSTPITYTYRWLRGGTAITGATAATYSVKSTDADHVVRCRLTAHNAGGSATATSAGVTIKAPPHNTSRPKITGSPASGHTLTCSKGSWTGSAPIGYKYQWLRNGTAIAGATAASYTVKVADVGHSLACRVTAHNVAGTGAATSAAVSIH